MHKYRLVAKKGEGTFSEVLKAQCIKNGKYVAIKCMKNHFDSLDQVNNLREIQALRRLSPHPHIIRLLEVLYDQPTGRLALVFELMDMNIYELIRGRRHYLAEDRIKMFMYQLVKAMDHMHRNGIFHRDIKPENILIMDDCLKLADFGSCRGIYSKQPYTEYISTRWYRAPECLLTDGYYNYKMDMWGVGCVFFEIVSLFPLFPGTNELDQIQKIHNIIGTPPPELLAKMKQRSQHMDFNFPAKEGTGIAKLIPHASSECIELVSKLLEYNPDDRLSARQALRHPYFRQLREQDKRQQALMSPEMSTTNASAEGGAQRSGPQANKGGDDHNSSLPSISGGAKAAAYPQGHGYGHAGHAHGHGHDDDHYDQKPRRASKPLHPAQHGSQHSLKNAGGHTTRLSLDPSGDPLPPIGHSSVHKQTAAQQQYRQKQQYGGGANVAAASNYSYYKMSQPQAMPYRQAGGVGAAVRHSGIAVPPSYQAAKAAAVERRGWGYGAAGSVPSKYVSPYSQRYLSKDK